MNNGKIIGVIGCNGFIGSVLVGDLLKRGYTVIGFDNCYKKIDSILNYFNDKNFSFQYCDITKEEHVKKIYTNKIDGIILLSGIVGLDACDGNISLATQVNDIGWKMVCKNKPKDIPLVVASTGSVFGAVASGLCTEETETKPLSHYGITKLAGEQHALEAGGIAFRFATAAGVSNSNRLNLLPNYLVHEAVHKKYLSIFQPDFMRTFIDIRDFCDVLIFGIEYHHKLKYQIYNAGDSSNNWSKREMVEYIQSKTQCKVDWHDNRTDNDARDYAVDYSRINSEGWKAKYKISDTLDSLLQVMPHVKIFNPYI